MVIIAEQDLLCPESEQFAERLQEEGVDVDARIYKGAPHPFMAMDKRLPSGRQAIRDVVECVKEILAAYEHSFDIKPRDVNNERGRENLSEQVPGHILGT
jgi:dienelactone hydrolase